MTEASPRPSRAWIVAMVVTIVLALAAASGAFMTYSEANSPVGEGTVFVEESDAAARSFTVDDRPEDVRLRAIRNDLEIEAVALVDESGAVSASTSGTLVGAAPPSPFLIRSHDRREFGAVAAMLPVPLYIDGVEEWASGSPAYVVTAPLQDGRSLLLFYDISALLERRTADGGIPAAAVQLAGAALGFLVLAGVLWFSHHRSLLRYREIDLEHRLLREHAEDLAATNQALERARERAEEAMEEAKHAYSLAEEKSRVRADFVLMINHELRTPLTALVTGAELLTAADELSPDDLAQITGDMVFNGKRLQEMIGQMLAVARMENRGLTVTMAPQSCGELLELAEAAHPRIEAGEGWERLGAQVALTDRATLGHLIASLVDNAFTHGATSVTLDVSDELPAEPDLEVGHRPADALFLSIVDDGPGIHPAFLPKAFEKFEKDSFSSGTGLGLFAARLMAEAISASLAISTSRLGTSLIIALPRVGAIPRRLSA